MRGVELMNKTTLTIADIKKHFPGLRPSQLDYMVRERIVSCIRSGRGRPRLFPPEAVKQIESFLSQVNPQRGSHDERSLD